MKLPRYSLRMLFIAVTAMAAICGWLTYHWNWIRHSDAARQWVLAHYGVAMTDGNDFIVTRPNGLQIRSRDGVLTIGGKPLDEKLPQSPFSLRILGKKSVYFIFLAGTRGEGEPPIDIQERDAKLPELKELFPETEFIVNYPKEP